MTQSIMQDCLAYIVEYLEEIPYTNITHIKEAKYINLRYQGKIIHISEDKNGTIIVGYCHNDGLGYSSLALQLEDPEIFNKLSRLLQELVK